MKYMPTNKWWAATATAAGTIVLAVWTGNGIDTDGEKTLVIGIVVQRVIAWLVPNDKTPGGVPS